MKKIYCLLACLFLLSTGISQGQTSFANKNSKLNSAAFHSGVTVAIADWNGDGMDDIIRLDQGHDCYVEVQRTNNTYETIHLGDFGGGSGWSWGMAVADVDHNGYLDIAAGGSGPDLKILLTNPTSIGTFFNCANSGFFVQNVTFADFNNDGWIDLFACDDNAQSHIFLNTGASTLIESTTIINFDVTSTDDSGNYGSVWTDFDNDGDLDLYIAKCRQGVNSPTDGRRINVMFVNDGNGNFTENAGAYGLNIGWQSWTASFGDIDNDGDLDLLITNHDYQSQILENDGAGHYTDITATTGFDITDITPIQSVMEDFDNDGYVDLLITGSASRFYHNNGNKTFTKITGMFNTNNMESFATGDLNHDGLVDVYASYASIYTNPTSTDDVVWLNSTRNSNHFVTIDLRGTISNIDAIGARATVYGSWGAQLKEVYAGEGYGRCNSAMLHFGLGTATTIDSIVVRFPSGITQTIVNPSVDQFITVIEGDCVSPMVGVTYSLANPVICTGTPETITATPGFNYAWSDGSTLDNISITTGGEYNVLITEIGNNCPSVSRTITIEQDPNQTPVLTTSGETEFCIGGTVDIAATSGLLGYAWSNGDVTDMITVNQSGLYYVMVQGYCAVFASDTIEVISHAVSAPVTAATVSIVGPASTTLSATGSIINWYDALAATTPVGTGNNFVTPILSTDTYYWVENSENYNGGNFSTGIPVAPNTYSGNTTNAQMYFTVTDNSILNSVKVYTDVAGTRRIELRDAAGTVLQFVDVAVAPDSQVVTLNFNLTPGNYTLTTNGAINQTSLGYASPRLRRNNGGVTYPYSIPNALIITGNNQGGQYYYYFYDWQVTREGLTCNSNRIQVLVGVTVGVQELSAAGIKLYPNPASDVLTIIQDNSEEWNVTISDATGRLVQSQQLNQQSTTLSLSGLATGMYQVNFQNSNKNISTRIVKQ